MLEDLELKIMINSGTDALFNLNENNNYIIKKLQDKYTDQVSTQIVIVEMENTGRLHENSRFIYYIQDFLEMKN